jgi:two-component sensor histidine kinase
MDHRVKNLFALAGGIVTIGARTAVTPKDLAHTVGERLGALARAHALTMSASPGESIRQAATLHALLNAILSPFEGKTDSGKDRITITGEDIRIAGDAVTGFALLLHEFATNAAKYGALSTPSGNIEICISQADESIGLTWKERGGPPIDGEIVHEGFGTVLARMTVTNQLGGDVVRDWQSDGLYIQLSMRRDRLQ